MIFSVCSKRFAIVRNFGPVALAAALAFAVAGCQTTQPMETTGSAAIAAAPRGDDAWRRSAEAWGERYRANPQDRGGGQLRAGAAWKRPALPGRRRARAGLDP